MNCDLDVYLTAYYERYLNISRLFIISYFLIEMRHYWLFSHPSASGFNVGYLRQFRDLRNRQYTFLIRFHLLRGKISFAWAFFLQSYSSVRQQQTALLRTVVKWLSINRHAGIITRSLFLSLQLVKTPTTHADSR